MVIINNAANVIQHMGLVLYLRFLPAHNIQHGMYNDYTETDSHANKFKPLSASGAVE